MSCKKDPIIDWTGNYIGKDFITRTTNGGAPMDEDPLDNTTVQITEKNDSNEPTEANLTFGIVLPFANSQNIMLYGLATCEPNFKLFDHETHNHFVHLPPAGRPRAGAVRR